MNWSTGYTTCRATHSRNAMLMDNNCMEDVEIQTIHTMEEMDMDMVIMEGLVKASTGSQITMSS